MPARRRLSSRRKSPWSSKYLDGGGKALIEIDPETDPKLDDILQAWNVNQGKNVVVDASGVGRLFGTGPAVPLVVDYGDSPITKNLKGGMTFFPLARTVSIADKNKGGHAGRRAAEDFAAKLHHSELAAERS